MRPLTSHSGDRRRSMRWALLPALIAVFAAVDLPEKASAAGCPVNPGNATAWTGGSGDIGDPGNWSNGTPSGACDVTITPAGSPTISMTGGINVRSLVLGGPGSTPHLVISDQSPNTNLDAQPAGITIAAGATVTLACLQPGGCPGGGGPDIYSGSSPFANAGVITVDATTDGGAVVGGVIANTGTIEFEKSGSLSGQVTNNGVIKVADGATATNSGSSCGGTEPFVKNDTGGTIAGEGTGVLSVLNFEQGAGATEDVVIPCGSLKYSGSGASDVQAFAGFNLTGEMRANQKLTISAASNNTNVTLQSDFTNKGSITLTCPVGGCSGSGGGPSGGAGFNANGHLFTNAGTFTIAPGSGTDAGTSNGMTNTGTMRFEQSGFLSGVVINKGTIEVANGEVAVSSTSSCGDSGPRVINDTGGKIVGLGTGTLSAVNFEQGAGTTVGSAPVTMACGTLKYVGAGASTIRVPSGSGGNATMTGNLAAGQTLSIVGQLYNGSFTSAGRIEGTGTINGSVTNNGVIAPGSSPGTLTVTGNYTQGSGGRLDVEVAGTGAGQFDTLAVGGIATLDGTLALLPTSGFVSSSSIGDSVTFLTYGNSVAGGFSQLTVNPSLPCGKVFVTSTDAGAKALKASVAAGGPSCGGGDGGGGGTGGGGTVQTPPPPIQPTPPKKQACPKGKKLKKGKCVKKTCPKGKKLKKGRCVKKKQPKARSRRA